MNMIPNELTIKYAKNKYPMSTGSEEWKNIKGEYEMIDDAIAGTVAHEDYNKSLGVEKVNEFKSSLEKFKVKVDNYTPKDDVEIKEKEILQNKVNIGLDIYQAVIGSIK